MAAPGGGARLREESVQPARGASGVHGLVEAPGPDAAVTGHAPLGHAEVDAAVLDEHVPLLERVGVEQHLDPLARGEASLRVLRFDSGRPAALPRRAADMIRSWESWARRTGVQFQTSFSYYKMIRNFRDSQRRER